MSIEIQRQIAAVLRKHKDQKIPLLQVIVHPSVLDRLRTEDEELLVNIESKFSVRLSFKPDPVRHLEEFTICDASNGEILYNTRNDSVPLVPEK